MMRILAIDDDNGYLRILRRYFAAAGHTVETAETGGEGTKMAAELAPDVVLLDYMLPDMTGADVLDALLSMKETRLIPVILISGRNFDAEEQARLKTCRNLKRLMEKPVLLRDVLREAAQLPRPAPVREQRSAGLPRMSAGGLEP